jgi:hypothetical protein
VLVAGGMGGYWLYGDRWPSVLSRTASGAAQQVTAAARRASERLDAGDDVGRPLERPSKEGPAADPSSRPAATPEWVPLDRPTEQRPPRPPRMLRQTGPAYLSLGAADIARLLGGELLRALPRSTRHPELALVADQLLVRAVVDRADVAGSGGVAAVVGALLSGRDTVQLTGTLEVARPGLALYHVREVRMAGVDVPPRMIPSLLHALQRRLPSDTVASDALPIPLPLIVGDVRIANGSVTLYKAVRP